MATTNINVRVDENLKKDADELFSDSGLNMSTAITMFLKSAVNNDGIPFEVKRKELNAQTVSAIEEVLKSNRYKELVANYKSVNLCKTCNMRKP